MKIKLADFSRLILNRTLQSIDEKKNKVKFGKVAKKKG